TEVRRLKAFLLFLDFLPRPLFLVGPFLPPSAADRPPLAGLDLPPRVHPEYEEDNDADDAAVDRVRLPRRLSDVHGHRSSVLRGAPGVRLRGVVHLHLDRLGSLTIAAHGEHELAGVACG